MPKPHTKTKTTVILLPALHGFNVHVVDENYHESEDRILTSFEFNPHLQAPISLERFEALKREAEGEGMILEKEWE